MKHLARVAAAFFYRDFVVYRGWIPGFIYSYSLQYPMLYGLCFGYLLPKIGMGNGSGVSVMAVGTMLYALFTSGFGVMSEFLMDFERTRTIYFKMQFVPLWLIVAQKIAFNAIFVFFSCALYVPMLKVLFYSDFDISNTSWLSFYIMLFLAAAFIATFQLFFACAVSSRKSIRHLWRRVNYPLIIFGGFLVPWYAMNKFSPVLGKVAMLNPVMYLTEGLRRAVLGADIFFSLPLCIAAIVLYIALFGSLSVVMLRRKIDAI
jgi:ABC-2 type transport system permease protein